MSTSSSDHQHPDKTAADNSSSVKEKVPEKVHTVTSLGEKKDVKKEEPSNTTISSLPGQSEAKHPAGDAHHPTTGGHSGTTHSAAKHLSATGHHVPTGGHSGATVTHPTHDGHHPTTKAHNA
jgi:hypothetical protein